MRKKKIIVSHFISLH